MDFELRAIGETRIGKAGGPGRFLQIGEDVGGDIGLETFGGGAQNAREFGVGTGIVAGFDRGQSAARNACLSCVMSVRSLAGPPNEIT